MEYVKGGYVQMIYLDNAATTYPKPEKVYKEMDRCMREYCANPGRGGHSMSIQSGQAVMEAREKVSRFFNISNPMQLCFTKNATEALNIAIKGSLKAGDHVITTSLEHNSVMRPLKLLERDLGVEVTVVRGDVFGEIDPDDIQKSIKKNTKLIVTTLSSNVNGILLPAKDIGKIAGENEIMYLLDGSQGAGTINIDVEDMNISMLAFPGHKSLMGPVGTGGLYIREGLKVNSILQGGTGSNSENFTQPEFMPDLMESGTVNTQGIVGLGHGIDFINSQGIENIRAHKYRLVKVLFEGVRELKNVKLYSKNHIEKNSGIVALNFEGVPSSEISYVLDKVYNIGTRAGMHCAPVAHDTLGTSITGAVRFSVGVFNTASEIEATINALKEISSNVGNI